MEYETIIGLEVHAQLLTKSKMFCPCSADYANAPPNTHVCPICLGMPGVLPTINKQAIEYAIMTALALDCSIPEHTRFDRKNYPYPDLMKGYQISQYDNPLSHNGWLTIEVDGKTRRIGITRVHQEEDVAKLFHRSDPSGDTYSLVDVNRAGVPLMEIVSEPDIRSPEEAREYLMKLHSILQYLGVCSGNMEEGSFRCDANVSIRPVGSTKFMSKVEVKNMNSFKAVYRALAFEVERQRKVLQEGGRLVQETRGWVEEKGATVSQRSKEYAHDYRYFPEPDLPPLSLSRQWVEDIRKQLPELSHARRERFMSQYRLSRYDATLLTESKELADYFEACVKLFPQDRALEKNAKMVANWLLGEFARLLNLEKTQIKDTKIPPSHLVGLITELSMNVVNTSTAKMVFEEMAATGKPAPQIIQEKRLEQISGASQLDDIIDRVLAENAAAAADFKKGKEQSLKFLVGQVMKATKGQANPQMVNELLKKKLNGK